MEFIKSKYFFWGLFAGLLWTSFGVLILLFFLSEVPLEESILKLYKKQKSPLSYIKNLRKWINYDKKAS